jgi:methylphosphotriester-DNA--protein-cysteine methyltransferase
METNQNLFCTAMFGYLEKQLHKMFKKTIPITPIEYLNTRILNVSKFNARFLAIYVSKIKADKINKDKSFDGKVKLKTLELF